MEEVKHKENIFDSMNNIRLDYLTVENFDDLVNCKYDLDIDDLVLCDKCKSVFSDEDIVRDEVEIEDTEDYWDYNKETPEQRETKYTNEVESCPYCGYGKDYEDETFSCTAYSLEDMLSGKIKGLEDYVAKSFMQRLNEYLKNLKENKDIKILNKMGESKMNLQEATIKALYDGLKDNTEIEDVEGLVDDVLVVTDPEITTDEYNEVIERASEIVEDTPEGDIPLDPTYLGEYVQICPICGGSFIEDHILEPGTACPICYETPEAFVMVGKLQDESDVASDNGLELEPEQPNDMESSMDMSNNISSSDETQIEEPVEEPKEMNDELDNIQNERPRGARLRRTRDVASKEIPNGNKLAESNLLETRVNQALLKNRETDKSYTYRELQDMYNQELQNKGYNSEDYTFEKYIDDMLKTGTYIDLTESNNQKVNNKLNKVQEDYERYKVSFYVDSTETPKDEIETKLNNALKNTGLASSNENIEIEIIEEINEAKESENDVVDDIDQNEETNSKYTIEEIDEDKIKELADNSAFTWEGMNTKADNLQDIVDDLEEKTDIVLPVHFYTYKGKMMNDMYGLTEKNAYPDDLTFLSISLDNWSGLGNLPIFKLQVGAKWLDDIVKNNQIRQNKIDGNETSDK